MKAKKNLEYMSIWISYLRWNLEMPIQLRPRVQHNEYHEYQQHKYHDVNNIRNNEERL